MADNQNKTLDAIKLIAPLVEQFGLPLITKLITVFNAPEDWPGLLKLTSVTGRQQMLERLVAHNIDPNGPAGQALLALTPE